MPSVHLEYEQILKRLFDFLRERLLKNVVVTVLEKKNLQSGGSR
ncbi:hypothetical protein ALTERO38_50084 [Alteromonas sp. 38]|nr:hypothetical protein ALTER154_90150 [Alteromonas sp. 154]VXB19254.1 hypothetical protein ALTERO38_50084 [Alteromonas sp. 38]